LVVRSARMVHELGKIGRPPRLLYALEMSAIRKSLWAVAERADDAERGLARRYGPQPAASTGG
jgi:hypothetical protein